MAETLQVPRQRATPKLTPALIPRFTPSQLSSQPLTTSDIRNGHQSLRTFSPVNETGSFEFDRILKSGEVLKRNRRTKTWKPVSIVLRPNLLSIYKDSHESQLRHRLTLSEITAVALQKDRRRKDHAGAFGVFHPSRNFHLEAPTEVEAKAWVELIRREARLDAAEHEIMYGSPGGTKDLYSGFERLRVSSSGGHDGGSRGMSSSSSEYERRPSDAHVTAPFAATQTRLRQSSLIRDASAPERTSYSDFSDAPGGGDAARDPPSPSSLGSQALEVRRTAARIYAGGVVDETLRNTSQISGLGRPDKEDRVVWHGYLLFLKSSRGVKQWKRCWVVLRPKTLALYKNEEEYAASLIIPISTVLDAVETDAISKSKPFCLQVIAEDRNYKFAAADDDDLSKWLGGIKSVLAKRKELVL